MIWLSVIRQFERILLAFLAGIGVFWLALQAVGPGAGVVGALAAYATGAALTLSLMIGLILRGTEVATEPGAAVLASLRRYPALVLVGSLYGLAIWADKFVFWFAEGVEAFPGIRSHPLYDSSFFLAYLTVVPALAINLVHLETTFYERYRAYYAAILGGFPLSAIEHRREAMVAELRDGSVRLVRTQGAITLLCVILAGKFSAALDMPDVAVRVFRFACLGAFFQVLFLITLLVQLYFDLRREAAISSAVYLLLNTVLAMWSVQAGIATYGMGNGIAALAALIVAFALLSRAIRLLNYLTFTRHARPNRS
jgi:uncharacterized membrane protein